MSMSMYTAFVAAAIVLATACTRTPSTPTPGPVPLPTKEPARPVASPDHDPMLVACVAACVNAETYCKEIDDPRACAIACVNAELPLAPVLCVANAESAAAIRTKCGLLNCTPRPVPVGI
jgi:hypothetical protein